MYKTCKVVMLPTNKKAKIGEYSISMYGKNGIKTGAFKDGNLNQGIVICDGDVKMIDQNLYIISDDEIKKGDYYLTDDRMTRSENNGTPIYVLLKCTSITNDWIESETRDGEGFNPDWSKKVIASTDKSLGLLTLSSAFINDYISKYNKGNSITDIQVEYITEHDLRTRDITKEFKDIPKINFEEELLHIRELKESYSRLEIEGLIHRFENAYAYKFNLQLNQTDRSLFIGNFLNNL